MRIRTIATVAAIAAALCSFTNLVATGPVLAAARPQRGPSIDEELERGRQMLSRREYFEAQKIFQRVNQLAGGKSPDAFLGMCQAMQGMKLFKSAVDACQSAVDLAQDNWRLLARAHKMRAQAFEAMGDLPSAETDYRAALTADPKATIPDLHYGLGRVLIAAGRTDEGIEELRKELEDRPIGTTADEARALIANPRRGGSAHAAPEFSIVSTDGQRLSNETLRGKIVLLDFWASWCDPCRRALPAVRKVQQDHAKDPFVIIGISDDHTERAWKSFTSQNRMVWPQYWDRDKALQRLFNVEAIPSYVLIDAEGYELRRVRGSGFDSARDLIAEIDKQITLLSR